MLHFVQDTSLIQFAYHDLWLSVITQQRLPHSACMGASYFSFSSGSCHPHVAKNMHINKLSTASWQSHRFILMHGPCVCSRVFPFWNNASFVAGKDIHYGLKRSLLNSSSVYSGANQSSFARPAPNLHQSNHDHAPRPRLHRVSGLSRQHEIRSSKLPESPRLATHTSPTYTSKRYVHAHHYFVRWC